MILKYYEITTNEGTSGQDKNGGDYWERERYHQLNNGSYMVTFHSSWDGSFCNACGRYGHSNCENIIIVNELPEGGEWLVKDYEPDHWFVRLLRIMSIKLITQ